VVRVCREVVDRQFMNRSGLPGVTGPIESVDHYTEAKEHFPLDNNSRFDYC
jgi:hypothetical protein